MQYTSALSITLIIKIGAYTRSHVTDLRKSTTKGSNGSIPLHMLQQPLSLNPTCSSAAHLHV